MDILITFLFIGGGFAEIPARLQPYEFCTDKAQEYITYVENPDYEEGNGQVWIHGTYNNKKIFATSSSKPCVSAKYFPITPCNSGYSPTKSEHKSDFEIDAAT